MSSLSSDLKNNIQKFKQEVEDEPNSSLIVNSILTQINVMIQILITGGELTWISVKVVLPMIFKFLIVLLKAGYLSAIVIIKTVIFISNIIDSGVSSMAEVYVTLEDRNTITNDRNNKIVDDDDDDDDDEQTYQSVHIRQRAGPTSQLFASLRSDELDILGQYGITQDSVPEGLEVGDVFRGEPQ